MQRHCCGLRSPVSETSQVSVLHFYIDVVGDCIGKTSVEVADEDLANIEAVRFAGELLKGKPVSILEDGVELRISDTDGWVVGVVCARFHRMPRRAPSLGTSDFASTSGWQP